ncbi:MAG: alpha/beta hydrolase [Phycisphaerae bacterium]
MKRFTPFLLALLTASLASAQTTGPSPQLTADVWPAGKMPGTAAAKPEAERPSKDPFHRITNISHPTLLFFPAPHQSAPAPCMIVCPGGGYNYVVIDKEGSEIASWLNSLGISAAVLKYRTPKNRDGAFQDTQRALSLARANASAWHIDPRRLGIIGFSAGGNLAAKASTLFDTRSYSPIDDIDKLSCRPDFDILVYPAYLERDGKLASDLNLHADIPPTLIVHNEDDKTFSPGTKLYHAALDNNHHPNELLFYPTGGHGYGLHCTGDAKAWPQDALPWLHKIGVLPN